MQREKRNAVFFDLANILMEKEGCAKATKEALALLCERFSYACGLIYQQDIFGKFCLMEQYGNSDSVGPDSFAVERLPRAGFAEKIGAPVLAAERGEACGPLEEALLQLFPVPALLAVPVEKAEGGISCLILLLRTTPGDEPQKEILPHIEGALSLLAKYTESLLYHTQVLQMKGCLENILDNTGIDIYVNDFLTHEILYVNESMAAPYGGKRAFSGQKCWRVLFPHQTGPCEFCPQTKLLDESGLPTKVYSWDYQRPFDGAWFRVFSKAFRWIDGRLAHLVSSADITENKKNEALIESLANYDQLTKLPNRRKLLRECERRIKVATQTEQGYIFFFDIDGFKSINDTLGHDAGDDFLIQLGAFFSSIPMLKDSIYRNGGDEFVAILGGETITKNHVTSLASFIHRRFQEPWKLAKGEVYCNTSIGVACYPEDGTTPEELIQIADMAMYQVKKAGGGSLCFGYQLKKKPYEIET